uniref:Uncharacterized protein n=1 Tax=Oryza meridionalis TaxID=40149 RepID=A0A0E0EDE6_9ORYZ
MASVVQYQAAAAAMACEEEFMPQGLISCFGRSLSRASSGRHLEYCSRDVSGGGGAGGEESRRMAQERSARAKLRWKAVAQEIMARRSGGGGGGGSGRRRKTAFSYDSKSYALNFDDQAAGAE